MKNILRIVAILIAVAIGYFIYQDNQKIQNAMDSMENSIVITTGSTETESELTTGTLEINNTDVIMSGTTVSTGELAGTPAPDLIDGATESSTDVLSSETSAQ